MPILSAKRWPPLPSSGSADDDKPPLTDRDYVLVGVTYDHSTTVLKRWNACPTRAMVEKRIASAKADKGYTGFALCNVVGLYAPPPPRP